jgi:hypothetical protein
MKNIICIISLYFLSSLSLLAQDPKEFFPLQIGNYWEYEYQNTIQTSCRIISDTFMDNKKQYFKICEILIDAPQYFHYYYRRMDDSGNIYEYDLYKKCENIILKVSPKINEMWKCSFFSVDCDTCRYYGFILDTTRISSRRYRKIFISDLPNTKGSISFGEFHYLEGVGLIKSWYHGEPAPTYIYKAIINGITVVDKGIIKVPEYREIEPISYKLYQNYPNPFNPNTKIKYAISTKENSRIRLIIYDLLGREIKILANGVSPPGEHELVWDGRNKYGNMVSSGIYFYMLEIMKSNKNPASIQVKKMFLIR